MDLFLKILNVDWLQFLLAGLGVFEFPGSRSSHLTEVEPVVPRFALVRLFQSGFFLDLLMHFYIARLPF